MANVQSIQRAFAILRQLAAREMGITEMSDSVALPKSTVARLLKTLEYEGAVERAEDEGKYRIGAAVASLVGSTSPVANLITLVRPHLILLSAEVGEDAGLSVPDGYRVHYVDQVDSENPVQVRDWTDESVPMHAVPSGLVILAHWPADALDRFLKRPLTAFTEATMTDPDQLRLRLAHVHDAGLAWVFEEFAEGINSVAAPLLDPRGRPVGAIHVHGPSYRFPEPGRVDDVTALVVAKARLIGEELSRAGTARVS